MKKFATVILLSSALLLPNHNVEASYSNQEHQEQKELIQSYFWNLQPFDFKQSYWNKKMTIYMYWKNHAHMDQKPEKECDWKKEPEVEENTKGEQVPEVEEVPKVEETPEVEKTPEPEEIPKVEETPKVEEAPGTDQTPEVEEAPEIEETPEVPSTPEQTPKPIVPAPTPDEPREPVENLQPNASVSAMEQEVLNLTNAERAKAGLAPLQFDQKLVESAKAKSKDMSVNNYFSHTSPTYGSPFDQMKSFGVTYRAAAENIASGQRSAQEVVRAWMNSPGHRQNILTPTFTHIGIGHAASGNYWTQQFIQK